MSPLSTRFSVNKFDEETYQVIDTEKEKEIALCNVYEGEPAPAKERADILAFLLNARGEMLIDIAELPYD